jgi:hypothetical protein
MCVDAGKVIQIWVCRGNVGEFIENGLLPDQHWYIDFLSWTPFRITDQKWTTGEERVLEFRS